MRTIGIFRELMDCSNVWVARTVGPPIFHSSFFGGIKKARILDVWTRSTQGLISYYLSRKKKEERNSASWCMMDRRHRPNHHDDRCLSEARSLNWQMVFHTHHHLTGKNPESQYAPCYRPVIPVYQHVRFICCDWNYSFSGFTNFRLNK